MEVNNLGVFHCTEGSFDKVWGWFQEASGQHQKFWGKRTADTFQILPVSTAQLAIDKSAKMKKKYMPLNSIESSVARRARRTLHAQFGIQAPATSTSPTPTASETSAVTGKTMPTPIKPSEVCRTFEANNIITFYDKNMDVLGTRSADMRETIFNHIRKTKDSVQSGNTPETIWTDK